MGQEVTAGKSFDLEFCEFLWACTSLPIATGGSCYLRLSFPHRLFKLDVGSVTQLQPGVKEQPVMELM